MWRERTTHTLVQQLDTEHIVETQYGSMSVRSMEVVYINQRFAEMTLTGYRLEMPSVAIARTYQKVKDLPAWAVPWTVFGADQVSD